MLGLEVLPAVLIGVGALVLVFVGAWIHGKGMTPPVVTQNDKDANENHDKGIRY